MNYRILTAALAFALIVAGITACQDKGGKEQAKTETQQAGSPIAWMSYDDGMSKAKEAHKPVMIDFYTTWCKYCKMLDDTTYKDAAIVEILNRDFVPIKINAEGNGTLTRDGKKMTEKDLAAEMKVTGFPTIWFFDENGKPIAPLPGYSPPEDFKVVLTYITSGAFAKGIPFDEYSKTTTKK